MPRSRPRLASSSNAIIFAAISSSPPWRTCGPADARDGRHAGQQSLPAAGPRLIARSRRLAVVTLAGRVPTPCLALSGGECKRKGGMTSPARRRTARKYRRLQPFGVVLFGRGSRFVRGLGGGVGVAPGARRRRGHQVARGGQGAG